jgi:hypothetical protein
MTPRPLDAVIDATLKIVPNDIPGYREFYETVSHIRDSVHYAAPEMTTYWWENFVEALETYCSPETYIAGQKVWVDNLVKMINGETDYKEYL